MRKLFLVLALVLFSATSAMATFSIVAIDPATGDMGIAVASRYFAVGAVVPWAEANVGAVATQAGVNVGYGARGLELLKQSPGLEGAQDRRDILSAGKHSGMTVGFVAYLAGKQDRDCCFQSRERINAAESIQAGLGQSERSRRI